ncbi:BRO-N domain-containing protein [Desulfovibrio piger]|uniref:BRO-N domain-containing protein n=1 Tax=Desulfovibrio piger TaxID=901 RepID=UPI002430EDAE|nr:Bro-N domain-containing protein [Desulfovibrio piger]MCI7508041.1 Bro-N domain-containing protein [Desulfovibrio piger]
MSNAIQPFAFEDHLVRTIMDDGGEPWFVAKDVCRVLGIEWKGSATMGPLDDDEKDMVTLSTSGGDQELLVVSESGLYALVFRSRKPQAREFSRWVRKEVLPSLRRTGRYALTEQDKAVGPQVPAWLGALTRVQRLHCLRLAVQARQQEEPGNVEEIFLRFCGYLALPEQGTEDVSLDSFVRTCCRQDEGSSLSAVDLYRAFAAWCERRGNARAVMTYRRFVQIIRGGRLLPMRRLRPSVIFAASLLP